MKQSTFSDLEYGSSTVQIGGAALTPRGARAKQGAVITPRLRSPIGCFAWMAGERNQVTIMKP